MMQIEVPRNALQDVRLHLMPIGRLLIELSQSGRVDVHGGWHKYAESGQLFEDTGITGRKTRCSQYIKLGHFAQEPGYEAFEAAVREANAAGVRFNDQSGLDWAMAVLQWLKGVPPPSSPAARPSREDREKALLRVCNLYKDWYRRLDVELGKAVAEGAWSDTVLNAVRSEISQAEGDTRWTKGGADIGSSSGIPELDPDTYGTPKLFYAEVDALLHFDGDACALPCNAKHENYFAPPHGLTAVYPPGSMWWMNPPYSAILQWLAQAFLGSRAGAGFACLVPGDTSTEWYEKYARRAAEIWTIRGRIKFDGAAAGSMFPCILVIFRPGAEGPPRFRHWQPRTLGGTGKLSE